MQNVERVYKNRTYVRAYPTSWDEMSAYHLLSYSRQLSRGTEAMLLSIALLKDWLQLPKKVYESILFGELLDLFPSLKFLSEEKPQSRRLFIERILCRFGMLHGPGENFRNLTVGEYSFADTVFEAYVTSKDEARLNELVACLYRPTNPLRLFNYLTKVADIRVEFNSRRVKKRAKRLSVPAPIKHAVFQNFMLFRNYTIANNPHLFNTGGEKSSEDDLGWAAVMHSMAGPELGTVYAIEKMLMGDALIILKKIDQDIRRMKKKIKSTEDDA